MSKPNHFQNRPADVRTASITPYVGALSAVLLFWLYLIVKLTGMGHNVLSLPELDLPALREMTGNLKLTWQGRTTGYTEACRAAAVFGMMGLFFLSFGKLLLNLILKEGTAEISGLERFALHYILGAVFSALLWLGIGTFGTLGFHTALAVGLVGLVVFPAIYVDWGSMKNMGFSRMREDCRSFLGRFSLTEKIMIFLLLLIVSSSALLAVIPQDFNDTLVTHLALPRFYAQEGKVLFYPYHLYTYFPQNNEMLVMWAILLKSEMAASLMMWGFLVAFAALLWGFISRLTDHLTALASVLIFISAPMCLGYATTVKTDFPSALLIVAHYMALYRSLSKRLDRQDGCKRWMLLAGVLCGGAVGFKHNALFAMLPSTVLALGSDLYFWKKYGDKNFHSGIWFLGGGLAAGPWFLRTFIETGNPIYPFLQSIAARPYVQDWHQHLKEIGRNMGSFSKMFLYLRASRDLIGLGMYHLGTRMQTPEWGPTVFFGVLTLFSFKKDFPLALRLCLGAAFFSWLSVLSYSAILNYQYGFLVFLICVPFALHFDLAVKRGPSRMITIATLSVVGLVLHKNLVHSAYLLNVTDAFNRLISGYPTGHYLTKDDRQNEMRWICRLIDTRAPAGENVIFTGTECNWPVTDRRMFFSLDKERLVSIAEGSKGLPDFKDNLLELGIKHILYRPRTIRLETQDPRKGLTVNDRELKMVNELLQNEMDLRFESPNKEFFWYSLKDGRPFSPIALSAEDIRAYPVNALQVADDLCKAGKLDEAERIERMALEEHIQPVQKIRAHWLLAAVHTRRGEKEKANEAARACLAEVPKDFDTVRDVADQLKKGKADELALLFYQEAVKLEPDFADGYYAIANIHYDRNDLQKASEGFMKAIEADPRHAKAHNDLGNVYFTLKDYDKAMDCFEKAVALEPYYAKALNNLGSAYFTRGDLAQASYYFKEAIRSDREYPNPHFNLGLVRLKEGNLDEALQELGIALELAPENEQYLNVLCLARNARKK